MTRYSFEAPLSSVVSQYGQLNTTGGLAVITRESSPEDLESIRQGGSKIQGLFVDFGQDGARTELARARNIAKAQNVQLHEIHIAGLASCFLQDGDLETYDVCTVLNTLHGLAVDFALYNSIATVYILEPFKRTSIHGALTAYYEALNQQLATIVGTEKILVYGSQKSGADVTQTGEKHMMSLQSDLVLMMLSGGPDSSVLLNELIRRYHQKVLVEAIFINFGQPYLAHELLSARNMANIAKVRLHEICIAGVSHAFVGKGEEGVGYPILRNLINSMYGLASDYARFRMAKELHHANILEDVINLPWLSSFFSAINITNQSVPSELQNHVDIRSEYLQIPKAEVVTRGVEMLGDRISQTYSCLTSNAIGVHCGKCRSCRNRRRAFVAAGVPDQTKYETEPLIGQVTPYEPPLAFI